ncbi:YkgJ family cysteine cluster protein [Chloroflexota bacterium]
MSHKVFRPSELVGQLQLCYRRGDWDILIPFHCHRCGRCCQVIGFPLERETVLKTAEGLGMSLEDFLTRYVGDIDGTTLVISRPKAPCHFLSDDNTCAIYDVRPNGCRSYPLTTTGGKCEVDCPGWEEHQSVIKALYRGIPGPIVVPYDQDQPLNRPTTDIWRILYPKFLKGKPSPEMKERFLHLNKIPEEILQEER